MIRILVADDDKEDIEIFSDAVKELNIDADIQVVRDGRQLLDLLSCDKEDKPDYLFLDLNMPKLSGFECLNHVRRHCDFDCMKIIILSGSVNVGEIDDAYDLGANYFLTKPSDLSEFKAYLLHIFNNKSTTPPSRAEFVLRHQHIKAMISHYP